MGSDGMGMDGRGTHVPLTVPSEVYDGARAEVLLLPEYYSCTAARSGTKNLFSQECYKYFQKYARGGLSFFQYTEKNTVAEGVIGSTAASSMS